MQKRAESLGHSGIQCTRCYPPGVKYITRKSKSAERQRAVSGSYEFAMISYSWMKSSNKQPGESLEVRRIPRKQKKHLRNWCLNGIGWPVR